MPKYTLKNFSIQSLREMLERFEKSYTRCDIDIDTDDNSLKVVPLIMRNEKLPPSSSSSEKRKNFDLDDLAETG